MFFFLLSFSLDIISLTLCFISELSENANAKKMFFEMVNKTTVDWSVNRTLELWWMSHRNDSFTLIQANSQV